MGLTPSRGPWRYETFDTLSTATFVTGSLVKFNTARNVSEYSGGEAYALGIAMHNSVNSLPAGKVVVAIPNAGCTAFADVPTTMAASALSRPEAMGIYKSGNTVSYITDAYTSAASNVCVVYGAPVLSPVSRIEVEFLHQSFVYDSNVSSAIA